MERPAIEWQDERSETRERTVLIGEDLGIPGLRLFGYNNTAHALSPLPSHYHKDCFEVTYVVQGNLNFSAAGKRYSLSGGDVYLTYPDEIHDTGRQPLSLHQIYWFQLENTAPDHFLFLSPEAGQLILEQLRQIPRRVVQMKKDGEAMLSRIFADLKEATAISRLEAGQLLGAFLCELLQESAHPSFRLTPDIGRATDYILLHLQDDLTLEELAGECCLSVSRFKQKFKSQMGVSPRSFINYQKIERAKALLTEGKTITEIAMELNFSSCAYFSSVFRRYTAQSPTEYAKNPT